MAIVWFRWAVRSENENASTASNSSAPTESTQQALFHDATDDAGIDFRHETAEPGSYFLPEIMGSGIALLDFDRDGDLDVYCVNFGTNYQPNLSQIARDGESVNRLFRQISRGRFEDVTAGSGLEDSGLGMGVAVGDVNNDGYPDIYVCNYGPDKLFLNQRGERFVEITVDAGIDNPAWSASASFIDYDRDGWLDLFVTNYVEYNQQSCTRVGGGDEDYCGPHRFRGTADRLFRNVTSTLATDDDGERVRAVGFVDVTIGSGIYTAQRPGLGVACADFNGDDWPDIYVANDQQANSLWINQQDGTFRDEAVIRGSAYDSQGRAQAGMGIAIGELRQTGGIDLFVTHLNGERNTLYRATGQGFFIDATKAASLGQNTLSTTGFGTAMFDIEHDGDLDVLIANGAVKRSEYADAGQPAGDSERTGASNFWTVYAQRNQVLLQQAAGTFREFRSRRDPFVSGLEVSRGLAVGDIDNDGDLDCLVMNTATKVKLYLNESPKKGSWLMVQAVEPKLGGRNAIGSRVVVIANGRRFARLVQPGYGYLSSNDPRVHFGLGPITTINSIEVIWNDGQRETFSGGPVNRHIVLQRGTGSSSE